MKKILNILIFLIPALQAILLQCALFFDTYFFYFIVSAFLFTDILLYLFIPKQFEKKKVFLLSFPPLALLLAISAALFFLEGDRLRMLLIGIHTALQLIYGIRMYRYIFKEGYPEVFFTETVSTILLVSYFFFSFSFYAVVYFVEISIWYISLPFLFITFLFFLTHSWMRGYTLQSHGLMIGAFLVLIFEMILVIRWLPSMHYIHAFFITVLYFVIISLGYGSLQKEMQPFKKILTVILSVGMVVLLILTAQWR